jgi:hypothetical protein
MSVNYDDFALAYREGLELSTARTHRGIKDEARKYACDRFPEASIYLEASGRMMNPPRSAETAEERYGTQISQRMSREWISYRNDHPEIQRRKRRGSSGRTPNGYKSVSRESTNNSDNPFESGSMRAKYFDFVSNHRFVWNDDATSYFTKQHRSGFGQVRQVCAKMGFIFSKTEEGWSITQPVVSNKKYSSENLDGDEDAILAAKILRIIKSMK